MTAPALSRRPLAATLLLLALLLGAGGVGLLWSTAVTAQALLADLSSHLIAITTSFTGSEVVLFGTTDGPGEVAVVVTGPKSRITVRRKDQTAGLWINRAAMVFEQVPGFYAVAASRPLAALAGPTVLARHEIGLDHLPLIPAGGVAAAGENLPAFREALLRNKQRQGLFDARIAPVVFLGERLFRTTLSFPSNVPTGAYTVWVFLIRDGEVLHAQTTPLAVSKLGTSAEIYEFAHRRPVLYGLAAVAGAVLIGWLAAKLFGKS